MKFEDAIAEIKRRVDIVRVIGQTVKLKKSGTNWTGLCPFHSEKTPSFYVRADKGYFKCFGCDAAGDVFTFLEKQSGQLFADIARKLADEVGITIDAPVRSDEEKRQISRREQLAQVLPLAQRYFRQSLTSAKGETLPLAYLVQERKFTPELIEKRELGFGGFDDRAFGALLKKENIDPALAEELGLQRRGTHGPYCFFAKRIVIPIRDHKGHLVGFGGRAFGSFAEGRPKYVNSPSSLVYDKSKILYGLFESLPLMKQGGAVVIAEGYFDVMAIQDVGVAAVAPCGTSLTQDHVNLLARFTKNIILCLDKDAAGQAAHKKALMILLKAGFHVRSAAITDKDPDALWRAGKKQQLKDAIVKSSDAIEALIKDTAVASVVGVAERIAAIEALLPFLCVSPSPLVNRQYVRLASQILKEDESLIIAEIQKIAPGSVAGRAKPVAAVSKKRAPIKWSDAEKLLLRALLSHPQVAKQSEPLRVVDLNPELQGFITELQGKWSANPGLAASDVLRLVPVARDSSIVSMLQDHERYVDLITEDEAQQIVAGWYTKAQEQKERAYIGQNHQNLLAAQSRGDIDTVRQALEEQSVALKANRTKRQLAKPQKNEVISEKSAPNDQKGSIFSPIPTSKPVVSPRISPPVDEDWNDDEGWT